MKKILLLCFVASCLFLGACHEKQSPHKHISGETMGTYYIIRYTDSLHRDIKPQVDSVLRAVNQSLSTYIPNSTISQINQANAPFYVNDPHFVAVYTKAVEVAENTNGAFDHTIMPLVNAWGFGFKNRENVDSAMVDSLLPLVNYKNVRFENDTIYKADPRIMIDFGAIAKGYGVDVVGEYLESIGIDNYMVEIGGDIRTKGVNREGNLWRIAIEQPDENQTGHNEFQAVVSLEDESIATSGNYRNFYVRDGKKYAHTISPFTGYPVQHTLLSSSVFALDCMTADAYATAFMVMGKEKALEIVNEVPGLKVYFIYDDGGESLQVYSSENLQQQLGEM